MLEEKLAESLKSFINEDFENKCIQKENSVIIYFDDEDYVILEFVKENKLSQFFIDIFKEENYNHAIELKEIIYDYIDNGVKKKRLSNAKECQCYAIAKFFQCKDYKFISDLIMVDLGVGYHIIVK